MLLLFVCARSASASEICVHSCFPCTDGYFRLRIKFVRMHVACREAYILLKSYLRIASNFWHSGRTVMLLCLLGLMRIGNLIFRNHLPLFDIATKLCMAVEAICFQANCRFDMCGRLTDVGMAICAVQF